MPSVGSFSVFVKAACSVCLCCVPLALPLFYVPPTVSFVSPQDFQRTWWPNLLECGDVEANPGPRLRGAQKSMPGAPFTLWNLNTRSGTAAWELMRLASDQNIPVLTMQEVRMFDKEIAALKKQAWNLGYTVHHATGPTVPVRGKADRTIGGVVTMVKRNLAHAPAFSLSGRGGQAVACWVTGTLIMNVYAAHHADRTNFLEELHSNFKPCSLSAVCCYR